MIARCRAAKANVGRVSRVGRRAGTRVEGRGLELHGDGRGRSLDEGVRVMGGASEGKDCRSRGGDLVLKWIDSMSATGEWYVPEMVLMAPGKSEDCDNAGVRTFQKNTP